MDSYNHEATLNAALAALQSGDLENAQKFAQRAADTRPDDAESWSVLGLASPGAAGEKALRKAVDMEPGEPRWHLHLGNGLTSQADHTGAETAYARAAELSKGHPEVMSAWGHSLMSLGRYADAAQVYRRALQAAPTSELWMKAGDALTGANDTINAAKAYERAHTNANRPPEMSARLADIHIMLGQYDKAEQFNTAVRASAPDDPDAGLRAANLLRWQGDHDGALAVQRQVWQKNTSHPGLIAALLDDKDESVLDAAIETVNNQSAEITGRRRAAFALARHFDRKQDEAQAWDYAQRANALYDDAITYDGGADHRAQLSKAIQIYKNMPESAPLQSKMIYVVGPPRCGGSLLQTILSQVAGAVSAGERGALMAWLLPGLDRPEDLKQNAPQLAYADIMGMQSAFGPADIYIDKTSPHILVAGLLAKIHAGARFILPLRSPKDMAVSMYFHDFPAEFAYTRSVRGIKDYLAVQDEAAAAWREAGLTLIDHDHEAFTADPSKQGQALFSQLGLPWSDDVLSAGGSGAVVRTFSARQVRGGVSRKYAGRGERYGNYLSDAGF